MSFILLQCKGVMSDKNEVRYDSLQENQNPYNFSFFTFNYLFAYFLYGEVNQLEVMIYVWRSGDNLGVNLSFYYVSPRIDFRSSGLVANTLHPWAMSLTPSSCIFNCSFVYSLMVYLYVCVHACKCLRILEESIRSEEQQSQLVMNHPTLVLGFELQFS